MTACRNKARGAVVAALAGALTLGAVPAVALATGTGASPMFVSPEGAFSEAKITNVTFSHGDSSKAVTDADSDGVWETEYDRNQPVTLKTVDVQMLTGDTSHPDFTIDATDPDDKFDVEYYARDTKTDKATGDAIEGDIVDAGSYVVKITALEGSGYEGGVIWVPFDITQIDISGITLHGELDSTYDAEAKKIAFELNGDHLYADDIDVTWYRTGGDLGDENVAAEVKDAGTYRAYIEGKGNYTGSADLNTQLVKVDALNLDNSNSDNQIYIPAVYSDSTSDPEVPGDLMIDGTWYGADSAIAKELKAELDPSTDVWHENRQYTYEVTEAEETDNIEGAYTMNAVKVGQLVNWGYEGGELEDSYEIIASQNPNGFNDNNIVATDAKGNKYTVEKTAVYDSIGIDVKGTKWWEVPGIYTCVYRVNSTDYSVGGQKVVTVTVYGDAIDADATAAVSFDGKVVTSVNTTYDGTDVAKKIKVVVKDDEGNDVNFSVSYFNADGEQVREMVNAGTYTLKVETPGYKLSGTTEMTVTIDPLTIGSVSSDKLQTKKFDHAGVSTVTYLPWDEDGYAVAPEGDVNGLGLYYLDEDGNKVWLVTDGFVNDVVKVTITNAAGEEVEKITDEGVYTVHFEARNEDAANNYVVPADLTLTCVKDSHLLYADVTYTDYFADAVAAVNDLGVMSGYTDVNGDPTGVFGATNSLTRGQVATILYRLANGAGFVETEPVYNEIFGYETGFEDCNGKAFYAQAVAWAKSVGVVEGYVDGTFHPEQAVTRQEFATMLKNYEQLFGDYSAADESVLDKFGDASEAADWAVDDLAWAVQEGILSGNLDGELMPADQIIRADAAVMIARYVG